MDNLKHRDSQSHFKLLGVACLRDTLHSRDLRALHWSLEHTCLLAHPSSHQFLMSLQLVPDDIEPESATARRLRDGIVLISRASALVLGPSITGILREILDALRVRTFLQPGTCGPWLTSR